MIKREVYKAAAAGVVSAYGMHLVTSLYLHRSKTHGAIKLNPKVEIAARTATWLLSGIKPREWVGVHRQHHAHEDREGDPHSPVLAGKRGVLKVLVGNVPRYQAAAKRLEPHDYPAELAPDALDRSLFDKGYLGQLALFGIFTMVNRGDVRKSIATMGVSRAAYAGLSLLSNDGMVVGTGGVINGLGHRGSGSLLQSLTGEPQPHADGTYTRNLPLPWLMGPLTVGEAFHDNHHRRQRELTFHPNPFLDPAGALGRGLIRVGLAEPGSGAPKLPAKPAS